MRKTAASEPTWEPGESSRGDELPGATASPSQELSGSEAQGRSATDSEKDKTLRRFPTCPSYAPQGNSLQPYRGSHKEEKKEKKKKKKKPKASTQPLYNIAKNSTAGSHTSRSAGQAQSGVPRADPRRPQPRWVCRGIAPGAEGGRGSSARSRRPGLERS